MAKCKDCLHYEACFAFSKIINAAVDVEKGCEHFKDHTEVAEVVRCKDCKHYKPQSKSAHWNSKALYCCRSASVKMKPDDFCSYGERREGE